MSVFDSCKLESSFDEMFDKKSGIRPHWTDVIKGLENAGIKQLEQKQLEIDWRLEDNGVTYNIYKNLHKLCFICSNINIFIFKLNFNRVFF